MARIRIALRYARYAATVLNIVAFGQGNSGPRN